MKTTIIGVYTDRNKAENAIISLNKVGIHNDERSCISTNRDGDVKDSQTVDKMESSAVTGGATGAAIGLLAGLVLANGVLPGIGSVLVAGPLVELLGITAIASTVIIGTVGGAVLGGIVGALIKLGVTDVDAIIYEEHLMSGNVLVIARTDSREAKEVLIKHGGAEVREYMTA